MKRILVGVDGSKESRAAARFGADIARATGASMVIASAINPVIALEGSPELIARANALADHERTHARTVLDEIVAEVGQNLSVETLVQDGAPAVTLSELARTGDVDLVIVGHRGRNAVARALLGSVADRLVQICPKPVLVVR